LDVPWINRLVADAKDGRSRSLVLRGEAGIGKTALLDYAESVAGGMRVLRVVGIESEADVAYAALQLMFVSELDRLAALPGAQRLESVCEGSPGRDIMVRAVPDLVEAAVRVGDTARARLFLPGLTDWATYTKSPVPSALLLRAQALLDDGGDADRRFEESLAVDRCGPYDQARTRLVFGEWLRRRRYSSAARRTKGWPPSGRAGRGSSTVSAPSSSNW
jgi:hypothetical protein